MMKGTWYKVPAELLNDDDISKGDCKVFAYVADRIKGETRAVSVRSIAVATELSLRSVQRSLQKLCNKRYLRADERPGQSTLYTQLLLPMSSRQRSSEPAVVVYNYEAYAREQFERLGDELEGKEVG